MIVFDVVVENQVVETLKPNNQRLREMQDFLIDRVEELKVKYEKFELFRRYIVLSV